MSPKSQRPSPLDALLYHDPSMTIGALLHFHGTRPPLQALTDHVRRRLSSIPALSSVMQGRGLQARWHQTHPTLEHHIRAHPLAAGDTTDDAVRELARAPFVPGAPPWDLTLLYGYARYRYAVLYRVNHGLQDGGGFVHALETLFTPTAIPYHRSSAAVRHLAEPPRPTLRETTAAARLLARATAKTGLWPHPQHGHSAERIFQWTAVPTPTLRALAAPFAGTVNDAYMATLAHAVQGWVTRYHPRPTPRTPVTVAVNARTTTTLALPGNHTAAGRLSLPGPGTPLPRALCDTVRAAAPLKSPAHREAVRRLTYGPPPWLVQASFKTLLRPERGSVFCSHLVFRNPLSFRGDPVDAVQPLTCLPLGSPASALLFTHRDRSSAVFVTDSALPGMDALHQRWRDTVSTAATTPTAARPTP